MKHKVLIDATKRRLKEEREEANIIAFLESPEWKATVEATMNSLKLTHQYVIYPQDGYIHEYKASRKFDMSHMRKSNVA